MNPFALRQALRCVLLLGCLPSLLAAAQAPPPILDMHMHARVADHYGPSPPPLCAPFERMPFWDPAESIETGLTFGDAPPCEHPVLPARTDEEVLSETLAIMERHNIYGVLGGSPELVARWMAAAPGRFIPGLDFRLDRATGSAAPGREEAPYEPMSPEAMRALYESGGFQVLEEVLNQFGGITPADERMAPYWALAEELDIPVGIHIGPGGPGEFYFGNRAYRASLQSALTLEEVLVRHPLLRVYIMHAGYPFLGDLIALLFSHPQVYVEVSMLANVEPRAGFYRYLQGIADAGYVDRLMFGSDQMIWPGIIEPAIQSIQNAPFLSEQQKRDIFYNNAARFLRLSEEEIARHHGVSP
jgi:uncharacterized protein